MYFLILIHMYHPPFYKENFMEFFYFKSQELLYFLYFYFLFIKIFNAEIYFKNFVGFLY